MPDDIEVLVVFLWEDVEICCNCKYGMIRCIPTWMEVIGNISTAA